MNSVSEDKSKGLADLAANLISLPDSVFESLLSRLRELMGVSSSDDAADLADALSEEFGIDIATLKPSIGWITFVAQASLDGEEKTMREGWLRVVSADARDAFAGKIDKIVLAVNSQTKLIAENEEAKAIRGLLPYFENLQATVELRAVIGGKSKTLGHLNREGSPIVGLVPIASVAIDLDSGLQSQFVFQLGRADISRFIASLVETAERMDELMVFASQGGAK